MDDTVMPKGQYNDDDKGLSEPDAMPKGVDRIPPELGNALIDGYRIPPPKGEAVEKIREDEAPRDTTHMPR